MPYRLATLMLHSECCSVIIPLPSLLMYEIVYCWKWVRIITHLRKYSLTLVFIASDTPVACYTYVPHTTHIVIILCIYVDSLGTYVGKNKNTKIYCKHISP